MLSKTSVILPCHNGSKWLSKSIDSVLGQTLPNFELIIIDDGSTDNSKETVAEYLHDDRIRYLCQSNKGFSAALNKGIQESSGIFIGFIGQDDLWLPNKLEVQMNYLYEHKDVDLVHSNYSTINSEGRVVKVRDVKIPRALTKKEAVEQLFLNNYIGFETVLVKKKCFNTVGSFDERMAGFSDHDIWLRIAGKYNIDGYIDFPLVEKREHKQQLSKAGDVILRDQFLIVDKAINCYPFLKKLERKKKASLYYAWGVSLLEKKKFGEGRQKLLRAICCQPSKIKAAAAYLASKQYMIFLKYYQQFAQKHKEFRWIEG